MTFKADDLRRIVRLAESIQQDMSRRLEPRADVLAALVMVVAVEAGTEVPADEYQSVVNLVTDLFKAGFDLGQKMKREMAAS